MSESTVGSGPPKRPGPKPAASRPAPRVEPERPRGKVQLGTVGAAGGDRVVLYGTGGIGKTTLAAMAPGPIAFADLDNSLRKLRPKFSDWGIAEPAVIPCATWLELRASLASDGWDEIKTIVIDSGSAAEQLAAQHLFATVKVKTEKGMQPAEGIEDYGYGKGYQYLFDTFCPLLSDLDRHCREGRHVIIVCHDCVANVPNPGGEDWIRYEPMLQKTSSGKASIRDRVKAWTDHVLFMRYDIAVNQDGKATGGQSVTIHPSDQPFAMAKSRTLQTSMSMQEAFDTGIWTKVFA